MSTKSLARNTAMQVTGKFLATFFGLLTVAILTRYMGAEGYGELTLAITFLSVFAVIVDFGLTLTTTQLISEHKADEQKLIGNLLAMRIITGVLFLALAPLIALLFPYSEGVKLAIAVGTFAYLFGSTAQMMIGIFQKRLVIGRFVIAELLNRSAVLAGAILAPLFGFGLVGIMMLFVIGNTLQLLSILTFAGRLVKLSFQFDLNTWRKIISRSWPIGASIFFNLIYLRGDVVFLSLYRSLDEVGIYGAAYKIVDVITAIPVMFMGLALPLLVKSWSSGHQKKFSEQLQEYFNFFAIVAWPIALGAIAVGPDLMAFISGEAFRQSGEVIMILGPASAMIFFGSLFGHTIVALNRQCIMTWGYLAVAVVTVAGYLIFIPRFGIWAAAWWTLISELLITLVTMAVVIRVSRFRPKWKIMSIAALAALVMYLSLLIVPSVHVLAQIALGAVIYSIALIALGGPRPRAVLDLFLPEKPPISQP